MAIGFVGGAFSTASTTAGGTKTIAYVPAAGNTLVVFGFGVGAAGAITNVTDTAGNVYYPRVGGGLNTVIANCWSTNPNASLTNVSNVITVTFAGSNRNTCVVGEYSGVTGIGRTGVSTGTSATPARVITTQNPNNWQVAGLTTEGTATWAANTGNLRENQTGAGSTTPGGGLVDNTVASAGSLTDSATISVSGAWSAASIELTTVQASEDSDNADGWWAGVYKGGATVALAAALAVAALAPNANAVASQHQDDPAGSLSGQPDEDFWPQALLPVPVAATFQRLPFLDPEELPAAALHGQPDEDFWTPQPAPVPASFQRLPFLDPEEIPAGKLSGQPDEDFWPQALLPAPGVSALYQRLPFSPDPEELPAGSLHGQPDEDFWPQALLPVPVAATFQRLPFLDPEEIPAGKLYGQPDEDFWPQALLPAPGVAALYQRLPFAPDPEELPAGSLHGQPDEDFWPQALLPVPLAAALQRLPFLDPEELSAGSLSGQPDEDFWPQALLPVPVAASFQRLPFLDPEELPAGKLSGQPDEDFWAAQPAPVAASFQRLPILFDSEIPAAAISSQPDEDFWALQPAPIAAAFQRLPNISEPDAVPTVPLPIQDEDFWPQALLPKPVAAALYQRLPIVDREELAELYAGHLRDTQDCLIFEIPVFPVATLVMPPIAGIGPQEFTLALENIVGENDSPFDFSEQVFLWLGDMFTLEATLPPMPLAEAEQWVAFLNALLGKHGTFLMGDFNRPVAQGPMSGAPVVNGANASGSNQLLVRTASVGVANWAIAGDYIQVTAPGGGLQRLHKILQNASTDGSGNTTLQIRPPIREPLIDGVTIVTANCQGTFRLQSNQQPWKIDRNRIYSISFKAREASLP